LRLLIPSILLVGLFWAVPKEEFKLLPSDVTLTGQGATQRLLVARMEDQLAVADHTAAAKFSSTNPSIVKVDETGVLEAVADGQATITARVGGATARLEVKVRGAGRQTPVSFENDVLPMFTKAG
jgi:hypothetical protein